MRGYWFIGQYRIQSRQNVFRASAVYFSASTYAYDSMLALPWYHQRTVFVPQRSLGRALCPGKSTLRRRCFPEIFLTLETSFSYVGGLELQLECQFASSRFRGTMTSYFMRRPLVGTPTSEIQFPEYNIRDYQCEGRSHFKHSGDLTWRSSWWAAVTAAEFRLLWVAPLQEFNYVRRNDCLNFKNAITLNVPDCQPNIIIFVNVFECTRIL